MKKILFALVAMLFAVSVNAENLSASEKMNQLKALGTSYQEKKAEMSACMKEDPEKAFCLATDCKKIINEIDGLIEGLSADIDGLEAEIAKLGDRPVIGVASDDEIMKYDAIKASSLRMKIVEINTFILKYYRDVFGMKVDCLR